MSKSTKSTHPKSGTTKPNKSTTKKLVKNHNKRVAASNKAFEKLSKAEKRVAIARDVLAQLKSKRLNPKFGVWVEYGDEINLKNEEDSVKEVLSKAKTCDVCALGACFVAAVDKHNNLKVNDLYYSGYNTVEDIDIFNYLSKWFSREQLDLIEAAFEQNNGYSSDARVTCYLIDVGDASEGMRLIMENIVVNKGTFKPSLEPVTTIVTPGFVG